MACITCPLTTGLQPRQSGRAKWLLVLYRRMMAYQALPFDGGLLDQEEETMQFLDVIHEELGSAKAGGGRGKVLMSSGTLEGRR